jgi:F5/8 type C domain-containing protein
MCRRLIYLLLTLSLLGSATVQAQGSAYDRVAYWDSDYGTAWAGDGGPVRDELEAVGYRVVDAAELKNWMTARIADRALSVVVMCRDAAPDTIAETQDENCTIRRYLEAGGKVVWYSDIPFYYQTTSGGTNTTWGDAGSTGVLGFGGSTAPRDAGDTVTITEAGETWGLVTPWTSTRPTLPDAWPNLTILAANDAGNASGWVAHYVEGDTFRGFVRIEDHTGGPVDIANLIAVAEYLEFFTTAIGPAPESGATDVVRDIELSWTPGEFASTHDVYFGASFDDVEAAERSNPLGVLVSQSQAATTYDPDGLLEFGQTYYWRIDEVNAAPDNTIFKGEVWSFTAEPFTYSIEGVVASSNLTADIGAGLENTVNGSGLNANDEHSVTSTDMWLGSPSGDDPMVIQYEFDGVYKLYEMLVWNYNVQFELLLGFGVKDVTVEYSENGADWTALGDVELTQAIAKATYTPNTTISFDGAAAKYVRLTINSGWGSLPQYGLSEVRFLFIPAQAREPQPADGAADVNIDTALAWRAGRDAVSHEVYFGTDSEALPLAGTVDTGSYALDALDLGTTYYWQITEVQDAESWAGALWSFATQDYLVVDDFESYNDEDNVIYETWIDGWVNETGSTVGYLEGPFAETTIVHSGIQSMPLFYDNAGVSTSEADFELAQNWTTNGVQSLSVYFYGDAANSGGQLYVKINNTRIDYDGPATSLLRAAWQLWNIDLSTAGNVSNVNSLTIGIEGAGASGTVYIDDIRLYPEVLGDSTADSPDITRAGDIVVGVPNDGDWPAGETPDLVIDDDSATKFLHFKGATEPTGIQVTPLAGASIVTGVTFTTANDAAERDPATFELYGSNDSIDGPYTLIASGDIVDFTGETAWPRFTKNETAISFANDVAYAHYQVLFTVRDPASANSMQVAEIELIGTVAP